MIPFVPAKLPKICQSQDFTHSIAQFACLFLTEFLPMGTATDDEETIEQEENESGIDEVLATLFSF